MFTNRFFTPLIIVVLAAVVGLTLREAVVTSAVGSELKDAERIQQSSAADTARWEAMGEYYANQAQRYAMDSGTRSYIARGEALEAAGKLGDSGACSNTTQENIFGGIDSNLDSATRSYIAWGLALQAKDDIRASCRAAAVESAESSSPIDECFDVSLNEVAACREASQSPSR